MPSCQQLWLAMNTKQLTGLQQFVAPAKQSVNRSNYI